ncbi:probable serine/threonine-protein kinase kinX [Culicoides brevitarsis]|uniref:probable serine/threonine-protein kinase kinX n=1 Tax=Culicoides brevitarsis TaxID=469753 RepID=UPI00307BEA11
MGLTVKVFILCTVTAAVLAVPVIQQDSPVQHYQPVEDLDAASEYDFQYSVHDEKSGDVKAHRESRDKDGVVKGSYSFIEADGHKRVVTYVVHKDSGFVANVNREKVSGYKAPEVVHKYEEPKYEVKYEEPKYEVKYEEPKYEVKHVKYEEPKYEVKYEQPKYESAPVNQIKFTQVDLSQYEKQYSVPEQAKYEEKQPEQPAKTVQAPAYETQEKPDLSAFLQQHQLPKYESEYKQEEYSHEEYKPQEHKYELPAEHKYEQYQLPVEQPKEAPAPTQYEQENSQKQTAPQTFYHEEQQPEPKAVEEPKYEVKYEEPKYEQPQPQVQYVFLKKSVEKPREGVIIPQVPHKEDEVKVKPYRFAPLENLYKFVINQAKAFDGAEPTPDFLK